MSWITPIMDRTQIDVDYAKINQNSISDLKGAFNISDANRIISNTIYLRDLLISNGYTVANFPNQPLITESSLPYINTIIGIMKNNIEKVVNAFYKDDNPQIPYGTVLDYNGVNAMEINLNITNTFLVRMINSLVRCGNYVVGQSILV